MVEDLLPSLRSAERITMMDRVDDHTLAALYDGAAFCIFPSEYEGYGLPVVEALGRGTPVLASNVGVVPELESRLLKRLPVRDADAWYLAMREWLVNASSVPAFSDAARDFHHPTCQQAAAETFAAINELTGRTVPT